MAKEYVVKILSIEDLTHNVKRIKTEKPDNFSFVPGHSALVSINKQELKNDKHPFTFTSLNSENFLEFIIKKYNNITKEIHNLKEEDELIIADVFGSVRYNKTGVFIAAGTGITPFLAIFKQLKEENKLGENKLIYSNKTKKDIIHKEELKEILKDNLILTLTREKNSEYKFGRITKEFLKENIKSFNQDFYVCGPSSFSSDVKKALKELKDEARVLEF